MYKFRPKTTFSFLEQSNMIFGKNVGNVSYVSMWGAQKRQLRIYKKKQKKNRLNTMFSVITNEIISYLDTLFLIFFHSEHEIK